MYAHIHSQSAVYLINTLHLTSCLTPQCIFVFVCYSCFMYQKIKLTIDSHYPNVLLLEW